MNSSGKERILNAAFQLFLEKGFDAVGIREIADHAGLSNPALYQHYKSKRELGEALYLSCYQRQNVELEKRLKPGMSVFERFDAFIDVAILLHKETPSPLLFLEKLQGDFGTVARGAYGEDAVTRRFRSWIVEGQKAGIVRKDVAVPMLVGLVIGQITLWALMSHLSLAPKRGAASAMKRLTRSALSTNQTR